ncbi:TraR/DksA family transcriptional regulator [Actinomadura sp. 21ATH]|uniref:TraR/DksA family transcriptional regulator n=1 Tax=Actinomadura sp. 21ATH TaxID=1735444 RepID=UPI0035C146BC
MTAEAEHAVPNEAAQEALRRLREDRGTRAEQLADLERSVEHLPPAEVEESAHTRMDNLREILKEIDGALQRVADGTYGRCERCAKDIPPGRLEILPHARFCVACQQRNAR